MHSVHGRCVDDAIITRCIRAVYAIYTRDAHQRDGGDLRAVSPLGEEGERKRLRVEAHAVTDRTAPRLRCCVVQRVVQCIVQCIEQCIEQCIVQ